MNTTLSGHVERAHTADLALLVWAETLDELFVQAADGMNNLLRPELDEGCEIFQTKISLKGMDAESLLVAFLSELLYSVEEKQILYEKFQIQVEDDCLIAEMQGQKLKKTGREIKAVTYSNLKILKNRSVYSTTLVFDV